MNDRTEVLEHGEEFDRLADALSRGAFGEARTLLGELHPGEVAVVLESLPQELREHVWELLDPEGVPEVYAESEEAVRSSRLARMEPEEVAELARRLDTDDAADLLQDLPEPMADEVLEAMDEQHRARLEAVLGYEEDTAGGLMNLDVLTVRADVTLEAVVRYLRRVGEIPEKTNRLFVVDRESRYQGSMRLAELIVSDPELAVADLMRDDPEGIPASMRAAEVALEFERLNLLTAPVVDEEGRLIGRITADDVMDVIRDEGEHSLMGLAGLDEDEDLLAPVFPTTARRALWLGINLATVLLAAWVIGLFESTIQAIVALAVLMPVVASMGGIAGSQALTVVIRGLANGQLRPANAPLVMRRELLVSLINGVLWAVVAAGVAIIWFDNLALAAVLAVALVMNLVVAAFSGAVIPILMRRMGIDAAVAGGVVLTTITDVVGFVAFLGLGTLVLL